MNLADVIKPELIKIPLLLDNKVGVINELVALLAEKGIIGNADEFLKAILEREKIMSTGVGNGIAIPHCKVRNVASFAVALGIHPRGIDFQSIDGQPADIVFLITGPESEAGSHIRLLSRISRIISRDDIRERLRTGSSSLELYDLLLSEEKKFLSSQY